MSDMTGLINSHNSTANRIDAWRDEVDVFLQQMNDFASEDPDTVLQQISAMAARLIEMRCQVVRSESRNMQAFRTKELDPVLSQVEFQFKVNSRRLSSMHLDWDMQKGAPG